MDTIDYDIDLYQLFGLNKFRSFTQVPRGSIFTTENLPQSAWHMMMSAESPYPAVFVLGREYNSCFFFNDDESVSELQDYDSSPIFMAALDGEFRFDQYVLLKEIDERTYQFA